MGTDVRNQDGNFDELVILPVVGEITSLSSLFRERTNKMRVTT